MAESSDDPTLLVSPSAGHGFPVIEASYATYSKRTEKNVDAADDPAIWINPVDRSKSLIFGTNKRIGLSSYDLHGNEKQFLKYGHANNVDVRYGFEFEPYGVIDLVGLTERSNNQIIIAGIDSSGIIFDIPGGRIDSGLDEVYGFCLYKDIESNRFYALANDKRGAVEQWLIWSEGGSLQADLVRELKLGSQLEGMVADDQLGVLYIGEEGKGVWRFDSSPDGNDRGEMIRLTGTANRNIEFDIEGLAIYPTSDSTGYLLVSSQGNHSFAIYTREVDNQYLGSFRIGGGKFDETRDTDGIEVVADSLSAEFPQGILVAQDGLSYVNDEIIPQDFKIVDFRKVLALITN